MRRAFPLGLLATAIPAIASAEAQLAYVSCPIYRDVDAGKKSGCWLAEDPRTGVRYDITNSAAKPEWGYGVMVEGVPVDRPQTACGAPVLDAVRVSTLLDRRCPNTVLPADGYRGYPFSLPKRNVRPLYEERAAETKPYKTRTFAIPFSFSSDYITYQLADYYMDMATTYALSVAPARIEVTGFADTTGRTIQAETFAEPRKLATMRARRVATWLTLRGVPAGSVVVKSRGTPRASSDEAFDGLTAPSLRRVEITVTPLPE